MPVPNGRRCSRIWLRAVKEPRRPVAYTVIIRTSSGELAATTQ
jgi:hypothetical protein